MSLRHEPRTLVATTVSVYRASLVDLRRSRTVHHVDTFPCLPLYGADDVPGTVDCRAVHYGQCVPVLVRVSDPSDRSAISIHVDPHYQRHDADAKKCRRPPMLALATAGGTGSGASSPPSPNSPAATASHVQARPLSTVSSSILSAVEKFEQKKNAGRMMGRTGDGKRDHRTSTSPVAPSAVNSASPHAADIGDQGRLLNATKVKGSAKETPEAKAKASGSGTAEDAYAMINSSLPKYDSCTWPSKKTSLSQLDKSHVDQIGSVKDKPKSEVAASSLRPKKTASVEKLTLSIDDVSGTTTNSSGDAKVSKKSESPKSVDKSPSKVQTNDKKRVDNNNKTKRSSPTSKATPTTCATSNGPSSLISGTPPKEPTIVSPSVIRPDPEDLLQEELEKILSTVSVQEPVRVPSPEKKAQQQTTASTLTTPAGRCEQDNHGPSNGRLSPVGRYADSNVLSPVDFARNRFQGARQVTTTKNRFENGQIHNSLDQWRPEWLPLQVQATVKRDDEQGPQQQGPLSSKKASEPEGTHSLPHPKLTTTQKQHIRERATSPTGYSAHVPIRPFLTKGSVAERVLIFERCPTSVTGATTTTPAKSKQHPALATGSQSKTAAAAAAQQQVKDKESKESTASSNHAKHASTKAQKNVHIPKFYFPYGRPSSSKEMEAALQRLVLTFSNLENGVATKEQFGIITKACDLPLYWKMPLFLAAGGDKKGYIQKDVFIDYWKKVLVSCHDDASRFMRILTKQSRNYLLPEDFVPLLQDVVNTHPGLTFLKEALEFHSRYIHTVIARIYYCVNRSWTGRITLAELRKSNFLQVVALLEEEEDINQITEYFSYEHFYVIYCKFWELDKDHDLYIDKNDLSRHNDHAISMRMIDRIFSGAVTRGRTQKEQKMSYTEFVWFLISEEDKRHPTSIEYWFRCMDLDGDGYLSMYELEYFYEEQLQRMEALGIETLPFKDCLCQMLDMIRPNVKGMISLSDLKNCRMTPIFFDTFFNLEKYLDHEQRDPFATQRDHDIEGPDISDWDRYAAEEYEFLVAEESTNEQGDDLAYDDEEDELSSNLAKLLMANNGKQGHIPNSVEVDEEYTDYADSDDYQY